MIRQRTVAAVAAAVLLVAACGDDDDDTSSSAPAASEPATESSAAPGSPSSEPSDSVAEPTGEPIKVGVAASSTENTLDPIQSGVEAGAEALNAEGGINGRPIEVVPCDLKSDPNTAAACGRTFVDEGVVAVLGLTGSVSQQAAEVYEAAGIPSLGDTGAGARGMSPLIYPVASGAFALFAGQGHLAGLAGATQVSLVRADLDITEGLSALFQPGLDQFGATFVNDVKVPVNAPDMAPYIAAAEANGAEAVILATLAPDEIKLIRAAKQSGSDLIIVANGNTIDDALAQGFAEDMEGVYSVGWFEPHTVTGDPGIDEFNADMDAIGYEGQRGMLTVNAWASVKLLEEVASTLDTIDPASIVAAMPSITEFDSGVAPPISYAQPLPVFGGQYFYSPFVFLSQVTGGVLEPVAEDFVDPFAAPEGA